MQIKVSKGDLEAALSVADIGISGSGNDLSTHFLFRINGDTAEVMAFHQRICASAPIKCQFDGEDGDAFTVEGKRLSRWLGGVGDVAVTIGHSDKDGQIRIKSPRSTIHVKSLDPSKFPFWDQTLKDATSAGTLAAERLASAFSYAKNFICDKDTTRPEISQIEIIDGVLWSTDRKAVTIIEMDGVDNAGIRVHGKDIATVTKFFGLKETENVEVLEHDRSVFFRRDDGALVGTSRPRTPFPRLNAPRVEEDLLWWEIKTSDLLAGIQCLSAAADWDNTKLAFKFKDGNVILAVESAAGEDREDVYPVEAMDSDGTENMPDDGFMIDYPYLNYIVGHFGGDTLRFGVNKKGTGGYVRFQHGDDKDTYLTVVVWRLDD